MANKQIDANAASYLIDVMVHLTKLEAAVRDLRWRYCHQDDLFVSTDVARKHCRELTEALRLAEYWIRDEAQKNAEREERETSVVKIDPRPSQIWKNPSNG